jgi:hypothetical protein
MATYWRRPGSRADPAPPAQAVAAGVRDGEREPGQRQQQRQCSRPAA